MSYQEAGPQTESAAWVCWKVYAEYTSERITDRNALRRGGRWIVIGKAAQAGSLAFSCNNLNNPTRHTAVPVNEWLPTSSNLRQAALGTFKKFKILFL